jgi:hypothetical protein
MGVKFKTVLMSEATCDVCGKGPLSFYTTLGEQRDLTPEEEATNHVDGGTDPRVKVVLCVLHMPGEPIKDGEAVVPPKVDGRTTAARRRKAQLVAAKAAGDKAAGR